jgi:type II secretory pathway component PulC
MVGTELMKEINLLGVISGANPQAVIEDKKSGKTYYVTEGQMIGDFQVEEIGYGKIILNYNGQKFELNI